MKIIKTLLLSLPMFAFCFTANAQMNNTTTFDTKIDKINRLQKTDFVQFDLKTENVINAQNISYWKVRSYCEKDMIIQVTASSTNDCGKAIKLNSLKNNSFSFLFDNKTNLTKNFSVKLKAYDKSGKWLHTEKESFRWK